MASNLALAKRAAPFSVPIQSAPDSSVLSARTRPGGNPSALIAFVRRHGDQSVACLFNLSPDPQVFDDPMLEGAELLPLRSGEADLRGASVGLSPYAAVFLRLA